MNNFDIIGHKINIFGNIHCGDFYLAKELSKLLGSNIIDLKSLMFVGASKRYRPSVITTKIQEMQQKNPTRIVYGPYASHQKNLLDDTDFLIFINLTKTEYEEYYKKTQVYDQKLFEYYMTYFQEKRYSESGGSSVEIYSQGLHKKFYNEFSGKKIEIRTIKEMTNLINDYKQLLNKEDVSSSEIIESLF